jgi:type I restriction enzyme, S subunit
MSSAKRRRGWQDGKLEDLVFFQRGFDITQAQQREGSYPVISSSGVTSYHDEFKVIGPGVVIGRKGTLGSIHFTAGDYWPHDTTLWSRHFKGNNPRFVYYFLHALDFKRFDVGNSNPTLNRNHIHDLAISIPPLSVQDNIANVLSAYDELLENNRRRMALLEESARLLYREWFVRLHFPGHQDARVTNGVPEGWTTYTLDDLCLIGRGASPRPIAHYMDGEIAWFKIGDATASESFYIFQTDEHVTDPGAKRSILLEPGALILSNSATCGIPYFTGVRGCIHDGWLHFADLKRISQEFLYCYLYFKRDELISSVGDGSTQKNLNTTAVGRLKFALPPQDYLLAQFLETVQPMFQMIFNLARQNISLRAARDLLLPRLMSGEIAV